LEIRFVSTEYDKPNPKYVDGLDMYKSLSNAFQLEDKDAIIKRLIGEICMLSHFIAKKMPEYVDFIGEVRNHKVTSDDLLSLNLNDPDMSNAEIFIVNDEPIKTIKNWDEI
jgi:hypothetical protein